VKDKHSRSQDAKGGKNYVEKGKNANSSDQRELNSWGAFSRRGNGEGGNMGKKNSK